MANNEQYLTYEQILRELQISRTELNRLIREGRLVEYVISGETKFRYSEVEALRGALDKRPTVFTEEDEDMAAQPPEVRVKEASEEPETEVLGDDWADQESEALVLEGEEGAEMAPETEVLEEDAQVAPAGELEILSEALAPEEEKLAAAEPKTDVLEEEAAAPEPGTEVLEEEGAALEPELTLEGEDVETPLADASKVGETSKETELNLEVKHLLEDEGTEGEEEGDFFDFTEAMDKDLELETSSDDLIKLDEPPATEDEKMITDILESEEEVAEEDLLSEIMDLDIGEDEEAAAGEDETAQITTMEEPTFTPAELGEGFEPDVGEEEVEEDFGDIYAVPVAAVAAEISGWVPVALVLTLLVMVFTSLFLVENAYDVSFSTHLTGWVRGLF